MKRLCGPLLLAACLLISLVQTRASTTNFWVQNVNYSVVAYVQSGGTILSGTLPTKQILSFLSGVTNLDNVLSYTTNVAVTNLKAVVTNSPYLPTNDFSTSYTISSNYGVTGGWTNNINFTNPVTFFLITNDPVTYSFSNNIPLTNGTTAYLFDKIHAANVTAVLSTNSDATNTIFELSGLTTNYTGVPIYALLPDFTKLKGAKLIYVTPIVDVTNIYNSLFMVRYNVGKTVTNLYVGNFFRDTGLTTSLVGSGNVTVPFYQFGWISFDTTLPTSFFGSLYPRQPGMVLNLYGLDSQYRGVVFSKGKIVGAGGRSGVLKTRRLVGNGGESVTGQIQSKTFNQNNALFSGSITFSLGHLETSISGL